jgi:hypothetical protein
MSCCKQSFILCESVPACIMQLTIKTPIISDECTLRFLDKFNKVYYVTKDTDVNGEMTVQIIEDDSDPLNVIEADLPVALLNQYAGEFKVMAYNSDNEIVQWTISGQQYDALVFEVKDITPVTDDYIIDPTFAEGYAGQFNL